MTSINNATREVFGNIAPWMRVVFFIMIAASIAVLVWQVVARSGSGVKVRQGGFERDWRVWSRRLVEYALAQKRVHRKSLGAFLHLLLIQWFRRADNRHHFIGDRLRRAVLLSPWLVLPHL